MATSLIRYIFLLFFAVLASIAMTSDGVGEEIQIPEPVNPGLNYLLSLTEPVHSQNFDSEVVQEVIKFVLSSKNKNALYFPGNRTNIASAYLEFDIQKDLKHILDIGFNPNIPPFILSPSSIRLAYWTYSFAFSRL
jgi:hypothetical protein